MRIRRKSSATSWNSNLAAYGIVSCAIFLELLQYVHHPLYPIRPQSSQAFTSNLSEDIMSRSNSSWVAPYPIRQSLSISPSRSPPSRDRPSVGCRVKVARGPLEFNETNQRHFRKQQRSGCIDVTDLARACILSITICSLVVRR